MPVAVEAAGKIGATLLAYVQVMKLRVGSMIALTAVAGLYAADQPVGLDVAIWVAAVVLMGSAGAGAINHAYEYDLDSAMYRTRSRPLPSGRITSRWSVVMFGLGLIGAGVGLGTWIFNPIVGLHIFLGALVYTVIYTVWLKRRSWLNVVVGGLAGSFAVLAGSAAGSPELCVAPLLLAGVLFLWSPSHFWSLAMVYRDDYLRGRVPMLPVVAGNAVAARAILINSALLVVLSIIPVTLDLLGTAYLVGAVVAGAVLLWPNYRLMAEPDSRHWAMVSFKASMAHLLLLFIGLFVDRGMGL